MRRTICARDRESSRADRLRSEEHKHARGGCQEEQTPPCSLDGEGGCNRPEEIPDLEDAVDEKLSRRACPNYDLNMPLTMRKRKGGLTCDANALEDFIKVESNQVVAGPLREEG
jgi:hypothetical protein